MKSIMYGMMKIKQGRGRAKMKKYQIKSVEMDEYVGLEAKVTIDGMNYHIAEQMRLGTSS